MKSVEGLTDDTSDLLLAARDYHGKNRAEPEELRIKMALQDLSMKVNGLADVTADASMVANCRSQVTTLRRSITGEHFEDEHTAPLPHVDKQYQSMAAAALDLKRALLRIKNRQFNP